MDTASFISDIHATGPNDKTLHSFLNNKVVEQSDTVFFLGDIFDFLVGEKSQYVEAYSPFFSKIVEFLNRGQKIIYIEGNHDFHFEKTFKKFIQKSSDNYHNFTYLKEGEVMTFGQQDFYVCHGDEVDYDNESFKKWKNIYTSSPFQILVNKLLPFRLINSIGQNASNDSKKRGRKSFDFDKAKNKYRKGALILNQSKKVDGVICGHTHIQENHQFEDQTIYLNCGFPREGKEFLHFKNNAFEFLNLEESSK